jgi:hypothetical protein
MARDPYGLLEAPFEDLTLAQRSSFLSEDNELASGGAAMTACTRMQLPAMSELKGDAIRNALLRYYELETLAMVMLYEAWREWVGKP